MMNTLKTLRFRITDRYGNCSYISVLNRHVEYCSATEVPLSLSNIAGANSVELRAAIEEAEPHRFDGSISGSNYTRPSRLCVEAINRFCPGVRVEPMQGDY